MLKNRVRDYFALQIQRGTYETSLVLLVRSMYVHKVFSEGSGKE